MPTISSTHSLFAPATIVGPVAPGAYTAQLANGHTCVVRAPKNGPGPYLTGERVVIELQPYDLSRGRIQSRLSEKILTTRPGSIA